MFEAFAKLLEAPKYVSFEKDWADFRLYAIRKHSNQMYGDMPYAYHLAMVETVLHEYGYSEYRYQAAAWLHDVLEDTDVSLNDLNASFGPIISALVYACTGEGVNRKARTQCIFERLKKYPEAAPVKIADRIANLSCCRREVAHGASPDKMRMYLKEWEGFRLNVQPLLLDDLRSRLIWEALDTLVENCRADLARLKKDEAAATEEKKGEEVATNDNPSQV